MDTNTSITIRFAYHTLDIFMVMVVLLILLPAIIIGLPLDVLLRFHPPNYRILAMLVGLTRNVV